uniref:Uncharacterized protein n=1 Tax=Coptotermes formosanus TaxID=36987 RepID=R4UJF1_COPFO|nr:hypothetical protein [Coptotermes formosanus]
MKAAGSLKCRCIFTRLLDIMLQSTVTKLDCCYCMVSVISCGVLFVLRES